MSQPYTIGARLKQDGTLITAGEFDQNTDGIRTGHSITVNTIFADDLDEITLTQGLPSGGSIDFNGTTQYLTVNSSTEFQFGTNDFTIEGWYFFRNVGYTRLWCFPDGDNVELTGSALYYWNGLTTSTSGNGVISQNQWYHIALVKHSGVVKLYVGGVSVLTDVAPFNSNQSRPLAIGGEVLTGADGFLDGYVANFRVVKGTAVYTGNFSTPISPLSNVTNTQLLLLVTTQATFLTDSSTNNTPVTNHGGAFYSDWTPLSTVYNGAMKQLKNGTLQVLNEFDEHTTIV
jgi:hypothetical protein